MSGAENILQFVKYVIGGCIATATHIIVFHIIAWKLFPALQKSDWFVRGFNLAVETIDDRTRSRNSVKSNAVAFMVSNMVAYLINIYWVFVPGRYHWLIEITFFYLVSGISIAIGTWLMALLIRRLGMITTYAFGSNLVTAVLINYVMRKFFIFAG